MTENVIVQDKGERRHHCRDVPPRSILPKPRREQKQKSDYKQRIQVIIDANGEHTFTEQRECDCILVKNIGWLDIPKVDVRFLAAQERRAAICKRTLIVIERPE